MKPASLLAPEEARSLRGVLFDLDDTVLTAGQLTLEAYVAMWNLHDAGLDLVAVTDDGTAVVTQDAVGGTRLWPTLDGSREPIVVHVPMARELGVMHDGTELAIAALDAVGARGEMERPSIVEMNRDFAADLGIDRRDVAAPRRLPFGKPSDDALITRPPQRARLGPLHQRRKILLTDLAQHADGIGRQIPGEVLREVAKCIVDRRAAARLAF